MEVYLAYLALLFLHLYNYYHDKSSITKAAMAWFRLLGLVSAAVSLAHLQFP